MIYENGIIQGTQCMLRPVVVADAEFIVNLRNDERNAKFISTSVPTVEAQEEWIKEYLYRYHAGFEYYFIACDLNGTPCGTVRLYRISALECTGGSWVMRTGTATAISLEVFLLPLRFAMTILLKSILHIDVRKENTRVWKWHEMCGAVFVSEDDQYRYYDYLPKSLKIAERIVASFT